MSIDVVVVPGRLCRHLCLWRGSSLLSVTDLEDVDLWMVICEIEIAVEDRAKAVVRYEEAADSSDQPGS